MGFQTFSILTEGVWASLTGGWYYDKKQSHFSNLFHLYIWLIFLCLPFVNYTFVNTYLSWFIYCIVIGIVFVIIKLVNAYFHRVFDTGKCIKDEIALSDQALGSATCNDIDENKDAFEMVVISNNNNNNNNLHNDDSSKFSNTSTHQDFLKPIQTAADQEEGCLTMEKQIVSKTIDFKADVHCSDTESSCANLSLLFRGEAEDVLEKESLLTKDEPKRKCTSEEPNQNTSLSNIGTTAYSNGTSLNNSIGAFESHNYDQMMTVRRARSELETMKHDDKTVLVPPSHPVSMEVINSKGYMNGTEESAQLDSNRFNTETDNKQLNIDLSSKPTTSSKDSFDMASLEKIEESAEKNQPCSSTYIADLDSSEDGDESEVSLFAHEDVKWKTMINRKLSKQPLRKARFGNNRKRGPKSTGRSATGHQDCSHKPQETELRFRFKPSSIVLLSTSDEDDEKPHTSAPIRGSVYDRYNSSSSDSVIPSSSSSLSSIDKNKTETMEILATPSTSAGIGRHSTTGQMKKQRNKQLSKHFERMIEEDYTGKQESFPIVFRNLGYFQNQQQNKDIEKNFQELIKTHNFDPESLLISRGKLLEKCSRSNSLRDAGSSKSSVVLPSSNLIAEILSSPGTHIATSHEDTSVGAVHLFQDERGNWFSYTFDENSTGLAKGLCALNPFYKLNNDSEKFKSSALVPSNSIFYLNNCGTTLVEQSPNPASGDTSKELVKHENLQSIGGNSSHTPDSFTSNQRNLCFDSIPMFDTNFGPANFRNLLFDASTTSELINSLNNHSFSHSYARSQQQLKQSQYYEVNIFNFKTVKIRFDRLALMAFMDRNLSYTELILSILLAILVAMLSSVLLYKNFFHDLSLAIFCLVVASSQYTLLKSVQPDAASPTHGFNQITIYSRPIYFIIISLILLASNEFINADYSKNISFVIYDVDILSREVIYSIHYISRAFLLAFPLLFTFGFLPQINTFAMYVFEQIDIHIFGGTASTMGMISATYSLVRSTLVCALLYLLAFILNIKDSQKASFSVFCGFLFALSYHISRLPSDPMLYWNVICSFFCQIQDFFKRLAKSSKTSEKPEEESHSPLEDPLPKKLRIITLCRLESDLIICVFFAITVFSVHVSSIFKLQPFVNNYTTLVAICWGFVLHYLIYHCRKQLPWLCLSNPVFKADEYKRFEVKSPARNMWFEKLQAWLWLLEKNVIFPLVFLSYITTDCPLLVNSYGPNLGIFLLVLFGFKCVRSTFNDPSNNYIILIFTLLFFNYDFKIINSQKSNIFLLNYFVVSIVYYKLNDFLLKLRFVITYVAPWQITWGSAFHAFAQPFSVPHSAMLLVQIFISSMLSSPLQPILGSAIFFASYVRPIKFWERDYNTKRVDHSNTRLASQIDKAQIGSDDNNLNSIFYEHLTRSLQHSLYGDLVLGRWGDVTQGDCFVLASDYLNCLVHIIELGNGLVTFQVRGLEFRGTYCQQREVEAISENVSDDEGCCWCNPGHFRGVLSVNAAFNQRWLSWEVTHTNYVLEGYSISENSASTILQPYDLRKALITNYVKSIIYYCITYKSFLKWIENLVLRESLSYLQEPNFVDLDPTFNLNIDEDFDHAASGITLASFKAIYLEWILNCIDQGVDSSKHEFVRKNEDFVISLCFGLSLLARRALGTAAHHNSALMSVDFFLYGFHALFKGDFRVHSIRDEWVFQDMDFFNKVIVPSVRMSLKLHQEQFTTYEEYESPRMLFDAITYFEKSIVISHEADPTWRASILTNVPSLLALRHVFEEGTDQYKVIMLNKRYLSFRVIKINRECVRGLWAGQQQELIFLRNRNPERGSIQNAKQVLRNIINSSCDQPIGYPIYVSPLTTSYAETSLPLSQIIGPPLSLRMFKNAICGFFQKIRNRCSEVCSSNVPNDLSYSVRLSKSESSDRGVDDQISKGTILSTHPQLTQMSNYSRYLRKKAMQEKANADDAATASADQNSLHNSTLVNLSSNRNFFSILANSQEATAAAAAAANISTGSIGNKSNIAETSFIHGESATTRSLIIEKSLPRGDAV